MVYAVMPNSSRQNVSPQMGDIAVTLSTFLFANTFTNCKAITCYVAFDTLPQSDQNNQLLQIKLQFLKKKPCSFFATVSTI